MIIYNYPPESLIKKITFEKNDDGGLRAYLHAGDGMSQDQMRHITEKLQCAGYQNTPAEREGEATLEVRGFFSAASCISNLKGHGLISGQPSIDRSKEAQLSFRERIANQSLFYSSPLYVLGDIKFIRYGMKGKSPLNIAGGIFYAAGTAFNLIFNRKSNADLEVRDIAQQMADYMNGLDIKAPQDSAMNRILDDGHKGIIEKIDDKLRHIPAELMVGSFAVAGACIATAAMKELNHGKITAGHVSEYMAKQAARAAKKPGIRIRSRAEAEKMLKTSHKVENWLDVGLGGMTMASGLVGAFIKEKAKDPDSPTKEGMEGWWDWVREHPLTVSGYGLMASTLCHAGSTALAYKNGRTDAKSAIFDRGVFVLTNLAAEFLISISSKGHGEGVKSDPSIDNSAINIAAELIARQPSDKQPEMIQYMAKFMGRQNVLALDDKETLEKLRHAVETQKKNPWAMATQPAANNDISKPTPASQTLPAWQAKIAAQPDVAPTLGA